MRRFGKWVVIVVAVAFVALVAFEGFAVWRARSRTPAILAGVAVRPLTLADLGARRIEMLLRVEDPGFYRHKGVDFTTPGQGMTSLTQSLVKILYFEHFQPGFEKIEQSLIARFVLTPAMSKRDQIEVLVNIAHLGRVDGKYVNGFGAASQAYFGKPLAQITDRQYLTLVAMLIAPKTFDPVAHPKENAERVARIEAMLGGKCAPEGLRDVYYKACAGKVSS